MQIEITQTEYRFYYEACLLGCVATDLYFFKKMHLFTDRGVKSANIHLREYYMKMIQYY